LLLGRAGVAVFFAYLSETDLFPEAEALAWQFLDESVSGLVGQRLDLSLTSGVAGIGWAFDHLNRYLCGRRDGGQLREIDATLEALLQTRRLQAFELLYGLAGVGVYALERLPARAARRMVRLVVGRLVEQAVGNRVGAAWWTAPGGLQNLPEGHYNLGMAHGNPGVVAFLARASRAGIAPRITRPLLDQATSWLLARRLPAGGPISFANVCDAEGGSGPGGRTAWCYGDPGVVAALFSASRASGNTSWTRATLRLARTAARRKGPESGVVDAGLCHGSAGLAQLFNRLWQATRQPVFRTAALHWVGETLAYRRPGQGIGGFMAIESAPSAPQVRVSDAGLLTGSAGIGLALLAAATAVEPAWDRVLLMDGW